MLSLTCVTLFSRLVYSLFVTIHTVFWALFGRGNQDAVSIGGYSSAFTEHTGYIIYGAYNAAMVTVLLNMLIAMMSRSFTLIAVSFH